MGKRPPGKIRLMGESPNSWDIRGMRDIRTASSMFMTLGEQESLESAMDFRALGLAAKRERDKFARQDAVAEKFKENYLKARDRLAATINKNRALMKLRHELQEGRRRGEDPDPEERNREKVNPPIDQRGFNEIELKY